jgi:hypothetical protein
MPRLTVLLMRHGETATEIPGEEPNLDELPNLSQLFQPAKGLLGELSRIIDPTLTTQGYLQAEESLRAIANVFRRASPMQVRQLALFSSPLQACTSSAVMITSAGFEPQEWSEWGLTTPETHMAPTAIPIVVANGLCDGTPAIRQVGGHQVVLDAGLVRCAASFWNKKYKKDPIMGVVQLMKDEMQDHVKTWVREGRGATTADAMHLSADTQFLKCAKDGNGTDPYGLAPMSLKFNLVTELLQPNMILDPHRKGCYEEELPSIPESVAVASLEACVLLARKAGCDTVVCIVSSNVIASLCDGFCSGPGDIASLVGDVGVDGGVRFSVHSTCSSHEFTEKHMPVFEGPVAASVPPPALWNGSMSGDEKWGAFPPAPPEKIPKSYPKDIPPFGQALVLDEPGGGVGWAWVHMPGDKHDGLAGGTFHAARG